MPPNRAAIEEGLAFEHRYARDTGGRRVPGSGSGHFLKLDVNQSNSILVGLKSAPTAKSFRFTSDHVHEVIKACEGAGGIDLMPAWAFDFQEIPESITAFRTSDVFRILRGEVRIADGHTKGEIRRATADVPLLLRG